MNPKKEMEKCNYSKLSLFIDGELGKKDYALINEHIKVCPSCLKVVQEERAIADIFKKKINHEVTQVNFKTIEEKIVANIRDSENAWWNNLNFGQIFKKASYSFAIAILLVIITTYSFIDDNTSITTPSAIINSIDGEISSVIILETKESRKTIIWFDEMS